MTRRREWQVPAVVLGAVGLVAGPLLVPAGYVLVGDMSFVPEQPWKEAWLGLDGSAPRAVPADAIVSLLTQVLPGAVVQRVLLLGALLLAGFGAARLARELGGLAGRAAPAAAALIYLWNPYVHERLGIGHWGLLLGYAALPWVALAAVALRRGDPGALARLVLAGAPAALGSPTGGLLAGAVAIVFAAGRDARRTASALGVVLVLNLPWLVPGMLGAAAGSDPGGVEAFAARSDTPFGVGGSLLTLGGIWKQGVVAGERDSWFLVLLALSAVVGALVTLVVLRTGDRVRLLLLGGVGFALAVLPATGPGADLVARLVGDVAGAGLLRDSQKFVALLAPATAVGFALLVRRVGLGVRALGLPSAPFAAALVALPVVVLPSLAWGLAGDLRPVRYPPGWSAVRDVLAAEPDTQRRTVVLPFSAYQRFAWNDGRAALDPAIRFLPGQVVTNDQLSVPGRVVAGDSPDAAAIAAALGRGESLEAVLAERGIRFVLLELSAAGGDALVTPAGTVRYDDGELRLVDTGNPARPARAEHRVAILGADLLTATGLVLSGCFLALRSIRRRFHQIG